MLSRLSNMNSRLLSNKAMNAFFGLGSSRTAFQRFVSHHHRNPMSPNHALQRTAPCVTAPASTAAFPPTMQVPRRAPLSLSLGSLGVISHIRVKWTLIIANLVAAVALLLLGSMAVSAHRTHAFSVYRELQLQHVLAERPDYDVQQRLRTIAAGGSYSLWLAYIGATACLANALIFGVCLKNSKP
jgi:hypothetical protein